MKIKHDYSYINEESNILIKKGLADLDIHSLVFDRWLSEEDKIENCDDFSKVIYKQMLPIAETLNSKYNMHQFTEGKSSMKHYVSDWDLFFYSNKGWNNKDYFDYMQISLNEKRTIEQNFKLLNTILQLLNDMETKNVLCRVQYQVREHDEEIKVKANNLCEKLLNKFIDYNGTIGKIKVIGEYNGKDLYGFFKKGSKKKYYEISSTSLIIQFE